VRQADRLGIMDMSLPGVEQGRAIVQWAFDEETSTGEVSRIFELEDLFVIAKLNLKQDEGIPSLDQIRPNITDIAIREKKNEQIAEEMQALMDGRSLDDIAATMELDVQEAENLSFNSRNIPDVGPEPIVIGTLFAQPDQTTKGPIKGNNGVFILEVTRMDDTSAPEDLTQARMTLQQTFKNRVPGEAFDAIKDNAKIEDNRALFF
jgi:peptidyl-prolyl cis-trans isomerase D